MMGFRAYTTNRVEICEVGLRRTHTRDATAMDEADLCGWTREGGDEVEEGLGKQRQRLREGVCRVFRGRAQERFQRARYIP
jgi:hypothetical protein